jgi:hypothetical protein
MLQKNVVSNAGSSENGQNGSADVLKFLEPGRMWHGMCLLPRQMGMDNLRWRFRRALNKYPAGREAHFGANREPSQK